MKDVTINNSSTLNVRAARFPAEVDVVRALFREYSADIGVDLCFQGFERELAELPGGYADPIGALLLGVDADGQAVGCVAVRPLPAAGGACGGGESKSCGGGERVCEMKRLYVRPSGRGTGLGRRLAERIVAEAERLGYERMRLDTLRTMTAARALYRALGFVEIPPYYANPIESAVYMELILGRQS